VILADKDVAMKTISLDQFEEIIARSDWVRLQEFDTPNDSEYDQIVWNNKTQDHDCIRVTKIYGLVRLTSTLNDMRITYTEGYAYDQYMPETLISNTDGIEPVWEYEGPDVVDEDGEILNAHELADYLPGEFSELDLEKLEIEEISDVDFDKDSDMETFVLDIDNEPNIRFSGELIASASSSDNSASGSDYSGQSGRWTELKLYKTVGGKFICHRIGRTTWSVEREQFSGKVCTNNEEIIDFFGNGWLSKKLFKEAGIESVIDIE